MKIYYDSNMPYVDEFFSEFGELIPFNGRSVTADTVKDADVLLIRSITEVNSTLLANNTKLQFVGTATIGKNHIDADYLKQRNIPFYSSPGCNANSVAEYVLSVLFALTEQRDISLAALNIGIVGGGNTGSAVAKKLSALGIAIKICDPHLNSHESAELMSMNELKTWSDVLCFHVPLITNGEFPTKHLMSESDFNALRPDQILINACRGEIFDNQALLCWKQSGAPNPVALDVWEQEPSILNELIPYTDISTVHIAGHSVLGKGRGTQMLYQRLCEHLCEKEKYTLEQFLPQNDIHDVTINSIERLVENADTFKFNLNVIQKLMRLVYDVRRDDAIMRNGIADKGFDVLRKQYPVRYECSLITIRCLEPLSEQLTKALIDIGFCVETERSI